MTASRSVRLIITGLLLAGVHISSVLAVPTVIGIDIRPRNDNNVVNPRTDDMVEVAILGSPGFNVNQINQSTVRFGRGAGGPADPGETRIKDINKDGRKDMLMRFPMPGTGIACRNTSATLTGMTNGGMQFTGTDSIITVGCDNWNDAPVGDSQSVNTPEDTAKVITLTGLDPNDDNPLSFTLLTPPANGLLGAITPLTATSAQVTYTPNADYFGPDSFTFKVTDSLGADSGAATVSITVDPVNDAPSFTRGADQTVLEDAGAQSVPGWATAIAKGPANESGQTLTFNVTGNTNPGLFAAGPSVAADGTLSYTPAANANGSATITIELMDSGGTANGGVDTSAPQSFVVNVTAVNDAPSFSAGADQIVPEDAGPQTVNGWATSVSPGPADESGQSLTFNITGNTNPGLFSAGPSAAADGTLTYTPAPNANGSTTITLELMDDGGTANGGVDTSAPQSFDITVTAVNDAPSFTKGADRNELSDAVPVSVPGWATGISPGPVDEAGQTLNFIIDSNDHPELFSAGPAVAADGTLTYTSVLNSGGTATIGVKLMDDGGTANGGVDTSAVQFFTITLTPPNAFPVPEDQNLSTDEDNALPITLSGTDGDGDALTFTITSPPANGSLGAPGAPNTIGNTTTVAVTYTPDPEYFGPDSFQFEVDDGNGGTATGTVSLTVNSVNDAPVFTGGGDVTVDEDSGAYDQPWASGISVGPANESAQIGTFDLNCTIPPGLFSAGPDIDGTTGNLSFTPAANASGTATCSVTLMDDGGTANGGVDTSAAQSLVINVTSINDPPTDLSLSPADIDENNSIGAAIGTLATVDADSTDIHTYTLVAGAGDTDNGAFSIAGDQLLAGVVFNFETRDSYSVRIQTDDGHGGTLQEAFTVSVNNVNDPPSATQDDYDGIGNTQLTVGNTLSGVPYVSLSGSVVDNDLDEDAGQTFTLTTTGPIATTHGGTADMDSDGTFTYTPPVGYEGTDDFSYQVCDNGVPSECSNGTVEITLTELVWYVDDSAAGGGNGQSQAPFQSLVSVNGPATDNDIIFVYAGTQSSGITLKNGQQLIGEGVGLTVNTIPLAAAGTRPVIGSGNPAVQLASGNTVRGLNISGAMRGIVGTGVGLATVGSVDVSTTGGRAVDIDNGTLTFTLDNLASASSGDGGIRLNNVGGGFTVSGTTGITHSGGTGITVSNSAFGAGDSMSFGDTTVSGPVGISLSGNGGAATFTFDSLSVTATAGNGLVASNSGTVNLTTDPVNTISASNGVAVSITGTTVGDGVGGPMTFTSVSSSNAVNGIVLNNIGGNGFTITGDVGSTRNASGGTLSNTTGDGILLTNVSALSFDQIRIDGTGAHGIKGTGVNGLTITNSSFNNNGDANPENVFDFQVAQGSGLSAITGTLTLNNIDVTNFQDAGLRILNDAGTLNVDIDAISFDDNDDAAGNGNAIWLESHGTASITATVDGCTSNNVENDLVTFQAGSSGTNDIGVRNNMVTNAGGPDDFPNGGGVELSVSNAATLTFDIQGNVLTDQRGDPVIIASTGTGGNLEGRIGGPNLVDGNILSGSSLGDGIQLTLDGPLGINAPRSFTILIQNNNIGNDGPFPGLGDDGIQILHRDNAGTLNLTIEDNTIANTASEGIRFFSDEDGGLGGGAPFSNVRIVDNAFINTTTNGFDNDIELRTSDTATACYHVAGNSNGSGGSPGVINFSIAGTSTGQITQASTAALSGGNNSATVSGDTPGFGGACTNPTLPAN